MNSCNGVSLSFSVEGGWQNMEVSSEELVLQNNIWCRNTSIYYCTMPNRTYMSFLDFEICS